MNKDLIGQESIAFPIACDLDKNIYLVPKQWVKDGINIHLAEYSYLFAKQLLAEKHLKIQTIRNISKGIKKVISLLKR